MESHVLYKGLVTEQTSLAINYILPEILGEIDPRNILEIGTAVGGLTTFLSDQCPKAEILTVEILDFYNYRFREGVTSLIGDVFSEKILEYEIPNFVGRDGTSLVLCDGGNKPKEFAYLSHFLKPGDYIAAHDYCFSWDVFKSKFYNKIWNYCRITESQIDQICKNHKLETRFEKSQDALWIFKQKTGGSQIGYQRNVI